jgi:hypothetical protein
MRLLAHEFFDGVDCNATALAEAYADTVGEADEGGPLDDPDHWIWEVAMTAAKRCEAELKR